MSRTQILAIGVDKVTMQEAVALCLAWARETETRLVFTPNAEIAYWADNDPAMADMLNHADLLIADGAGVVLASKILGDPVPEKVAGVELGTNVLAALSENGGGSVYLLGAEPAVVAEAARRMGQQFPRVRVVGYHHGFFTPEQEPGIIAEIAALQPNVLIVGMGVPKQEQWLSAHRHELKAGVAMGLGGTINIWAGAAPRAPRWMINANLEWLFRIVKFGRYGRSLPPLMKFMLSVFGRRLRGK